jgi:hypothetical protein
MLLPEHEMVALERHLRVRQSWFRRVGADPASCQNTSHPPKGEGFFAFSAPRKKGWPSLAPFSE